MNEYLGNISLTDQWLFCTDLIYFKNFVQNSPVSVPELSILNRPVGIETRGPPNKLNLPPNKLNRPPNN